MCVFLLLINPKFQWVSFQEVKPVFPVYIDNSSSIGYLSSLESVETLKRQIAYWSDDANRCEKTLEVVHLYYDGFE
jgi:hypothetical protein